jgi:protocatechuate 3,4-dioxygenase beta subunit
LALADGSGPALRASRFKVLAAIVLAAGVAIGVGTQHAGLNANPQPEPPKPTASEPAKPVADASIEFAGRVQGPDGRPVKGASVYVLYYTPEARPVPPRAETDAEGAFRFTMKPTDFERSYVHEPWRGAFVVAKADGLALGWSVAHTRDQPGSDLTIRLPKDDRELTGRLLSLEGKPLAGVSVRLTELLAPQPGKNLDGFFPELKARKAGYRVQRDFLDGFEGTWIGRDVGTLFPPVRTDADGRFRVPGVGADRLAVVRFESPAVESRSVRVLTRPAETVTVPETDQSGIPDQPTMTYTGTGFSFALAPGRTVTGTVRDKATGNPIAGAVIVSEVTASHSISGRHEFRTVAERNGKYTLHGLPLGRGNVLRAAPPGGEPYLMQLRDVPVPAGFNPAAVDFELTRGVVLTLNPVDAATGKPVAGFAEYFTFPDNPAYRAIQGYARPDRDEGAAQDGRLRVIAPPGPGLVAFRAKDNRYPIAVGAEQFKDRQRGALLGTVPYLLHPTNYHVLHPVEPKAGMQSLEVVIKLNPGTVVAGRVLDPDGKPLAGALARGLQPSPTVFGQWERAPLKEAQFEVVSADPKQPRAIAFIHKEKKLAGMVRIGGDAKGPVEVKLQAWGTLTGRLVNADGKPQADVQLGFVRKIDEPDPSAVGDLPDREIRTDADGRFTLSGFVPGLRYNLTARDARRLLARIGEGITFQAGEAKDVGDVTVRPPE